MNATKLIEVIEKNGATYYETWDEEGRLLAFHGKEKPANAVVIETVDLRTLEGPRFPIPPELADEYGMLSFD